MAEARRRAVRLGAFFYCTVRGRLLVGTEHCSTVQLDDLLDHCPALVVVLMAMEDGLTVDLVCRGG
jgi:hypothetical protein